MAYFYFSHDGDKYWGFPLKKFIFCDKHKAELGIEDFLTGARNIFGSDTWVSIEKSFAESGRPVPLKELTIMQWRPQ